MISVAEPSLPGRYVIFRSGATLQTLSNAFNIGGESVAQTARVLYADGVIFANHPVLTNGIMLADGRSTLARAWWISVFPGVAIMVTTMSINFIGDGLRQALDPRMKVH